MTGKLSVRWIDRHAAPKCQPDPAYPLGIDVDLSSGNTGCKTSVPWPAPRIGCYLVECLTCGANAVVTTAGRQDDPRTVKLACKDRS